MTSGGGNWRGWTASPLARLTAFAFLLAVLAAVAALIGRASGVEVEEPAGHDSSGQAPHGGGARPAATANGLSDAGDGLRLQLDPVKLDAGVRSRLELAIVDADGEPIWPLHGENGESRSTSSRWGTGSSSGPARRSPPTASSRRAVPRSTGRF